MVSAGDLIKAKYRVERVLGEGGMGVVVAAHHVGLDQKVAVKFLHADMLAHKDVVERFAREARAASKLRSDHVARVVDVDALPDGTPFIVMEYLEGRDLQSVVASGEAVRVHVAVGYVLEACDAIGEAHRVGIVHRDIKPANLFLADLGGGKRRVKVLDFGISKMETAEPQQRSRVTRNQAAMGTAEYMSPEQMRSARDVDPRTDIWALGVTLYELLTHALPFDGENFAEICANVMSKSPPPPSRFRADVPAGLDVVVMRCLEKDRELRYPSIEALAAALAPFTADVGSSGALPSLAALRSGIESMPTISARQAAKLGTLPSEVGPGADGTHGAPSIPVISASTGPSTIGAVSSGRGAGAGSSRWLFVVGAVLALGAGGTALALLRGPRDVVAAPAASPQPTAAASPSAPAPTPSPTPEVAPAAAAAAASAEPSASASASAESSAAKPEPRRTTKAPSKAAPAPAKPNCDPPFTVDANGIKHVKRECFNH